MAFYALKIEADAIVAEAHLCAIVWVYVTRFPHEPQVHDALPLVQVDFRAIEPANRIKTPQ